MTNINNMEDLIRLLDENPQYVEVLRARLLTRELLELPEKFARYAEDSNQRFERLEQQFERLEKQFARYAEDSNRRFERLEQRFERLEQQFERLEQQFERLEQQFERLEQQFARFAEDSNQRSERLEQQFARYAEDSNQRFERMDQRFAKIEVDLGYLRGAHARNAAIEDADIIAEYMGLHRVRNLSRRELWEMTRAADVSHLTPGELRSFRHADLVMETTDSEGQPRYIAAEISFTVNGRDTTRAIRNARLLTAFTGIAADPAVIGVYRDNRVHYVTDSGELYWYPLSDDDLGVD